VLPRSQSRLLPCHCCFSHPPSAVRRFRRRVGRARPQYDLVQGVEPQLFAARRPSRAVQEAIRRGEVNLTPRSSRPLDIGMLRSVASRRGDLNGCDHSRARSAAQFIVFHSAAGTVYRAGLHERFEGVAFRAINLPYLAVLRVFHAACGALQRTRGASHGQLPRGVPRGQTDLHVFSKT
jgi:hypothetical protein